MSIHVLFTLKYLHLNNYATTHYIILFTNLISNIFIKQSFVLYNEVRLEPYRVNDGL